MHKTSNTVPFPGDGSLKFTPFTLNNLWWSVYICELNGRITYDDCAMQHIFWLFWQQISRWNKHQDEVRKILTELKKHV
jgi:hypothetical protein